jgi:hypothetical protein
VELVFPMKYLAVIFTSLISASFLSLVTVKAHAGTISVERWRGHDVLRLSGKITRGLAEELSDMEGLASVWADGTKILLLDSPGGEVGEAFKISKVLDETPFHTVVPNEASCASACGSIVFVAGRFRTVEPFGRIGQHSCSRNGNPNQSCNDRIAEHAVQHGIAFGAIMAFLSFASPDDMIWFSAEDVDGWGLSSYPGEEESGFERSEPRVTRMLTGKMPHSQAAWRLDFHEDGYRAFSRTLSDAEREMQINLFCYESLPGRLFLSLEVHGDAGQIERATTKATVTTQDFSWENHHPSILQQDRTVTAVTMEIPRNYINSFLTSSDQLVFAVDLQPPYSPMRATTYLAQSRTNLLFATNHCARQAYDLDGQAFSRSVRRKK